MTTESLTTERWRALFTQISSDAFHLELRDCYGVPGETSRFTRWLAGHRETWEETADWYSDWTGLIRVHAAAGRTVRRLRVVTEPLGDYIRFEHNDTPHLVAAGEQVRWLPRHRLPASLDLPYDGRDFWLLDDRAAVFGRFDVDGRPTGKELVTDPGLVANAVQARDLLWPIAVPHDAYTPVVAV